MIFEPRITSPLVTDINWKHYLNGGVNPCIRITNNSVLPNCVGYAWGRWFEILKIATGDGTHLLSTGNAENWWIKNDTYKRGQTPKLGAVACWRKGKAGVANDGAGHVSIVEDILSDGSIITSNSAYLGTRFYMRTIKPPYNIGATYVFQGFIYSPIEFLPNGKLFMKDLYTVAKEVIEGRWGNGADRKAKLMVAGYNPIVVQTEVNNLIIKNKVVPIKTIDQIAQEVINGKWNNGIIRRISLIKAGYNYEEIMKRVNQLLAPTEKKKTIDQIAREVISGKWGAGIARKEALIHAGYDYAAVQKRVNQLFKFK
jgi:hypothetical protein